MVSVYSCIFHILDLKLFLILFLKYVCQDELVSTSQTGTVAAWVKMTNSFGGMVLGYGGADESGAGDTFQVLLSGQKLFLLFVDFSNGSNTIYGNTTMDKNKWYHVVVISNGSQYFMYVNGTLQTITVLLGSNNGNWLGDVTATNPVVSAIGRGRRDGSWQYPFIGLIDDVRIYDRALSASEVKRLYQMGR